MWQLLSASQNLPFSVALVLMLGIAVLEGVTALFGVAASELLESIGPEIDADIDNNSGYGH